MPASEGDFGFVGEWSTTANIHQDSQRLMNWYPEIDPNKTAKVVVSLLGTPGLETVASVVGLGDG